MPNIFKFSTLNINYLTDYKKNLLYEILQDNKIQILGLAKTHLNKKQAKFYFKQFKDQYTFYYSIDKENIKSTGVGIMIRNNLNLHVIKFDSYQGRVIYHWSKNNLSYIYPTYILHISVPDMCSII
jgi:exonuclease III